MAVNFAKLFLTIKNEVRGVAPDLVLIVNQLKTSKSL